MKSWVDFYNKRALSFNSPEEIGCHYIDNEKFHQLSLIKKDYV